MSVTQRFVPTFVAQDKDIDALYGPLPSPTSSHLFKAGFRASGEFGENAPLKFDYDISGTYGLGVDIKGPSLGEVDITYPVETTLDLPEVVSPGEKFAIATGETFASLAPTIAGESLNFGEVGLDLLFGTKPGRIENFEVLNVFGKGVPIKGAIDLKPLPVDDYRLLTISAGVGDDAKIVNGIELEYASPGGEEGSKVGEARSADGTLETLALAIREPLVSVEFSILDLLSNFPQLKPLDILKGDAEFKLPGHEAEFEYVFASIDASGGYGLVQTLTFDPSDVEVTIDIAGKSKSGTLGDNFSFRAPKELGGGTVKGQATYDIDGALKTEIELAPIGKLGYELISGEATLRQAGQPEFFKAAFGPVKEGSVTGDAGRFGKVPVFKDKMDLPPGFFDEVKLDFEIDLEPGGDGIETQPPVVEETSGQPPVITGYDTFQEGDLIFLRLNYTDPDGDAEGFGFRGVKGSGWAEETHPFSDPSYGRVSEGTIAYPFNHLATTDRAYESDVEAWIYDKEGLRSDPVKVHLKPEKQLQKEVAEPLPAEEEGQFYKIYVPSDLDPIGGTAG